MVEMLELKEQMQRLSQAVQQEEVLDQAAAVRDTTWATSQLRNLISGALGRSVALELTSGTRLTGKVDFVGADFMVLSQPRATLVNLYALTGLAMTKGNFALGGLVSDIEIHQAFWRLASQVPSAQACLVGSNQVSWQVMRTGADWVALRAFESSSEQVDVLGRCLVAPLGALAFLVFNPVVTASEVVVQLSGLHSPLPPSTNL